MVAPIFNIFEYIGVITFSISGAYVAMERKMDLFGIYLLATVTAVGGGVLRDVVMDIGIPRFFTSYTNIFLIIIGASLAIFLKNTKRLYWTMTICDAIGLSVFAVDTGIKALNLAYNFPEFLFVSVITAVGGGVIRDTLAGRVPAILRKDVYASAAIAGVILLWFLFPIIGSQWSMYICSLFIFFIRIISVRLDVHLPVVKL